MSSATAASAVAAPPVSRPTAILLLGWVGATKATGASLATIALVDATRALSMAERVSALATSIGTLAVAATVIGTGLAADRLGRRRVLMWSYVVCTVGSLMSMLATGQWLYVAGLAVAGIGFGAMFAGSYAYVKAVAPGPKLGWALGLFSAYCALLAAITSLAGGFLADYSWRLLFAVVPVMCTVAALATPRLLPLMPTVKSGVVDWWGLVLLGLAMVLILGGISRGVDHTDGLMVGMLAAGVVLMAGWVVVELRSHRPSFPVRLFATGAFAGAVIVGISFNVIQAASTLALADYWQFLGRRSVLEVTVGIQPFYLVGIAGALVAGRMLSAGTAPRGVVVASCGLGAVGFGLLSAVAPTASYWYFLPAVCLIGVAMAAGTTAQSQVFVQQAPADTYGSVTASKTSVGQLGSALGFAMAAVVGDRLTAGGVRRRLSEAGVDSHSINNSLQGLESYVRTGKAGTTDLARETLSAAAASYHHAYTVTMVLCAVILAVSAALTWWLMRPRPDTVESGTDG